MQSALASGIPLERPLVLADVGCRWGIPDAWRAQSDLLRIYAFDADAEECARLQADAPTNVCYVPAALGAREETAVLHVTAEAACSSLFPPHPSALSAFPELRVASLVGTREISIRTLDGWAASAGVERIDVVKLDVQGAELEVLRGAEQLLHGIRLIELEVAFNPMYKGQPLFGEIDAFLRSRGFLLWRIAHLVHYATHAQRSVLVSRVDRQFFDSRPVEFAVGPGQLTWGHAYYCAPELIHGGWSSWSLALRDACAAELFGFQEIAEPALAAARAMRSEQLV